MGLMPAGRGIYKHGTEQYLVQTPLIEPKEIAEVVENARQGRITRHLSARPVLPEEVIEWAILHNQSSLSVRDLFSKFGGELQRIDKMSLLLLLKEMEGKDYRVLDHVYQVLPGIGNRPRALVQLDGADTAPPGPESQNGTQNTADIDFRCRYCGRQNDLGAVECAACGAPLE